MTKLAIALTAVALFTGAAMAQTINNAPQNSPAGTQDQVKQAPMTGDSSTGRRYSLSKSKRACKVQRRTPTDQSWLETKGELIS